MSNGELRIELSPTLKPGHWRVQLRNGRVHSPRSTIQLPVTEAELKSLRQSPWQRNRRLLEDVGAKIWNGVIATKLGDWVRNQIRAMIDRVGPPLRLIFALRGASRTAGTIDVAEVPFEGLYDTAFSFVALAGTSISRTLHDTPTLEPLPISGRLRVLLVVATPNGYLNASAAAEVAAIEGALGTLISERRIDLRSVPNATVQSLSEHIHSFQPHVVHFIGHGGFESSGDDEASEPFLCFEDGTHDAWPHHVKAEALQTVFEHTGRGLVRLFVASACSTAAAGNGASPPRPYGLVFDGMAQRIVHSTCAASIGMQFDFEDWAATAFAKAFYEALAEDARLDDCVTRARQQIIRVPLKGDASERAWITPVVYSRYKSNRAFRRTPIASPELQALEITIKTLRDVLADLWRRAIAARGGESREVLIQQVERLHQLGGDLAARLGTCVWLQPGTGRRGERVACSLRLRIPAAAIAAAEILVSFSVTLIHPGLRCIRIDKGTHSQKVPKVEARDGGLGTLVTVLRPARYQPWPDGNCELAKLWFEADRRPIELEPPMEVTEDGFAFVEIVFSNAELEMGRGPIVCQAVPGLVCLV
jgi:hypothetical protein